MLLVIGRFSWQILASPGRSGKIVLFPAAERHLRLAAFVKSDAFKAAARTTRWKVAPLKSQEKPQKDLTSCNARNVVKGFSKSRLFLPCFLCSTKCGDPSA